MKPVVLSLQGCMATGKTTAVQYLQIQEPRILLALNRTCHVIEEVKRRNWIRINTRLPRNPETMAEK